MVTPAQQRKALEAELLQHNRKLTHERRRGIAEVRRAIKQYGKANVQIIENANGCGGCYARTDCIVTRPMTFAEMRQIEIASLDKRKQAKLMEDSLSAYCAFADDFPGMQLIGWLNRNNVVRCEIDECSRAGLRTTPNMVLHGGHGTCDFATVLLANGFHRDFVKLITMPQHYRRRYNAATVRPSQPKLADKPTQPVNWTKEGF